MREVPVHNVRLVSSTL